MFDGSAQFNETDDCVQSVRLLWQQHAHSLTPLLWRNWESWSAAIVSHWDVCVCVGVIWPTSSSPTKVFPGASASNTPHHTHTNTAVCYVCVSNLSVTSELVNHSVGPDPSNFLSLRPACSLRVTLSDLISLIDWSELSVIQTHSLFQTLSPKRKEVTCDCTYFTPYSILTESTTRLNWKDVVLLVWSVQLV